MSPRPSSAERILTSAQALILSKGFPATTIDEICEAAGVTKGGFYYHFDSKDQLAMALIDHYFGRVAQALVGDGSSGVGDPMERVHRFLDQAIAAAQGPVLKDGCVLGALTLDLAETNEVIRRAVSQRFSDLAAGLEADLEAVLSTRPTKRPLTAAALARQFLAVLEGSILLSKAHGDPELLVEGLEHYRLGLDAVLESAV